MRMLQSQQNISVHDVDNRWLAVDNKKHKQLKYLKPSKTTTLFNPLDSKGN